MNITVGREQNYWRAKCADKDTCAARTAAGNIGAYWRGPHRTDKREAHADAVQHAVTKHGVLSMCSKLLCSRPAVGVVRRQGATMLRCIDHHVDLRGLA